MINRGSKPLRGHRALLVIFLFCMLVAVTEATRGTYNTKCKVDNDCNPPNLVCTNKKCKNKSLFPMLPMEIGGMFFMIFLAMFATIAGIGGGPVFNPLLILMFNMTQKEAIALANALTVFTSSSKMINSLRLRDPEVPQKVLINYEVMLSLSPLLLLGAAIGAIINEFLAQIVPMITFLVLILYCLYQGLKKSIQLCRQERTQREKLEAAKKHRQEEELGQHSPSGLGGTSLVPGPEEPSSPVKTEGVNDYTFNPKDELALENVTERNKLIQVAPLKTEQSDQKNLLTLETSTMSPNKDSGLSAEDQKIKQKILFQEDRNWTWWNAGIIIGIFIIANMTTLLRGGSGLNSIVGVQKCSSIDFTILALYIALSFCFAFVGTAYVTWKQKQKIRLGIMYPKEPVWGMYKYTYGWIYVVIVGAAAVVAGMGGGTIMTPFMYAMDLYPKSASATALFLIFISRLVVTVINYYVGVLLWDYMFFIGAFVAITSFAADNLSIFIQKRVKRQSFISLMYFWMVALCTCIFIGAMVKQLVEASQDNRDVWAFTAYCPS